MISKDFLGIDTLFIVLLKVVEGIAPQTRQGVIEKIPRTLDRLRILGSLESLLGGITVDNLLRAISMALQNGIENSAG